MGYNKNFVVKNGLEVATNLIYANADNLRVGIGTTIPLYALHAPGGIGATFANIGVGTFQDLVLNGIISIGSSSGSLGQYLVNTGAGVTWQTLPSVRTSSTQTATTSQTLFSFAYTVGLLDVFINGVKLTATEFTATDGASVTITQPCFGGETVEFIAYSTVSAGVGYTGINGITVQNSGITTGNGLSITSINFTGAGVTAVGSGAGVTVTIAGAGGSGTNYWSQTAAGINTLSNVGIGTTNPGYADHVNGNNNPANLPSSSLTVGSVGTSNTSFVVNGKAFINGIHIHTGLFPSPQSNAFFGWRAGMLSASGGLNAAFGAGALTTPSGTWCSAFGDGALAIATGNENSAFGSSAGGSLTNGTRNTLIGRFTGGYLTSGSNNTLVGWYAGSGSLNASTSNNTYLGYQSGVSMSTGSYNTIIGSFNGVQSGLDIRSSSNNVVISDGNGDVRFYANSSGNVGIGTTNPTEALHVGGNARVGINTSQGVILTSPDGTKYQLFVENGGTLKTIAV
jgi:hypothetical protein